MPRLERCVTRSLLLLAVFGALTVLPRSSCAQIAGAASYYVPEAGPVAAPVVGALASRFIRGCPNNDGATSYPNSARNRIHLEGPAGVPLVGVPAASIYCKFNGGPVACVPPPAGLPAADEIIANGIVNFVAACPLVQFLTADAPTDAAGNAYITFQGALPAAPGVGVRDPGHKWGHYDDVPVYVIDPVTLVETPIVGRLTTLALPGTYGLQIKTFDIAGGVNCIANLGEVVSAGDFNAIANSIGQPAIGIMFWRDFDGSGAVGVADFNLLTAHVNHDCDTPLFP